MFDFTLATTPEICVELGRRLRARRLVQGWSQIELAQRAGISAGTIASRNGNATVAPTPRRKVRRWMCFPVMKDMSLRLLD